MSLDVVDPQWEVRVKLPVWKTIGKAYQTFFTNFGSVLRLSWLWLLVLGPLIAYLSEQQMSWMAHVHDVISTGGELPSPGAFFSWRSQALSFASSLIFAVAGASVAVAWHRYVLLGERPALSGSNVATRNVWQYLFTGLIIFFIAFLPAAPLAWASFFVAAGSHTIVRGPMALLLAVLFLIAMVLCFLALTRFVLLLPARAIGNNALTFRQCWKRTAGNSWRIGLGCLLTAMPPLTLPQLIITATILPKLAPIPPRLATAIPFDAISGEFVWLSAVTVIYSLFASLIMIGFLSFAYRYFFQAAAAPAEIEAE